MSAPTSTTPGLEELMPAARKLAEKERAVPSKRALKNALSIGFDRAKAVHAVLLAESEQRRLERDRESRIATARTRPAPPERDRTRAVPEVVSAGLAEKVAGPLAVVPSPQVEPVRETLTPAVSASDPKRFSRWPLLLLALPAFVAIWAGWVDLGRLTGFGLVHPLPGIADRFSINTAITLPIGLETYAAYALRVWMSGAVPARARVFARWSAIVSLLLGFAGQAAYHLMIAAGMEVAPWPIILAVSGVPVAVLGAGAALWHMVHND